MEEYLIKLLIECDELNHKVATHKSMCPSSSVEEIAEYVGKKFQRQMEIAREYRETQPTMEQIWR